MNNRELLGVSASASKAEIKQAYRKAAKELHPDLSDSPEAAQAFARIKEAHDALLKDADSPRESVTAQRSAAHAAAATTSAAQAYHHSQQQMTDEDLEHIQNLDSQARQKPKRKNIFRRAQESAELRRHRKKIKTNNDRISGIY